MKMEKGDDSDDVIGFVGGGNMSTIIVKGIIKSESQPPSKIWVSGPHIQNLMHWKEMGTHVTRNNVEVLQNCNIIFLGVKPNVLQKVITECFMVMSSGHKIKDNIVLVSMIAGVKIQHLRNMITQVNSMIAKNIKIVRIMPNSPMTIGAGACLYTFDTQNFLTHKQQSSVQRLLKALGICEKVEESMMDSLGVLTACGPAFIYVIIEALADGAVKQGVPRATALRFAAQMVSGSAQMVLETGKHPAQLKDEVCSPAGSTISGVAALENGNLRATLINAIEAATLKTMEFSK